MQTLDQWITRISQATTVALDTETDSLEPMRARIVGLSFSVEPFEACYIPLAHAGPDAPEQLPMDEVLALLNTARVPCAPVKTAREVAYDPHLEARGFWVDVDHPRRGKTRVPISPIRLHTGGKSEIKRPAPTLGQHNRELLAETGVDDAAYEALKAAGTAVEGAT